MVTTCAPRGALLALAIALILAAPAAANVKPVCNDASYTVESGAILALQANCSDGDGPAALTYGLVSGVGFGSLIGTPAGNATYQSALGYVGTDSFRYQAFDGQDASDPATVTIQVTPASVPGGNRAPVCPDPLNFVPRSGFLDLVGHCIDPDDDPVSYGLSTFPSGGSLAILGPASVRYTPFPGTDTDSFRYTASDPFLATTERTVRIQVVPDGTQDVATGTDATETDPYVVGVHSDGSAPVTVAARAMSTLPPTGFYFVGQEFDITAPDGSLADPLRLTFTIDRLSVPAGALSIFRDGVQVQDPCPAVLTEGSLPCVKSTETLQPSEDLRVVVLTDHASRWNLAIPATMPFAGFYSPVNARPIFNAMTAGRAVPVKFSLGGDRGLNILAGGYPRSQQIACTDETVDGIELTVAAGGSSLSYDAVSDQYSYIWKTNASWAGTCRQLVVRLTDGTSHRANFRFR